MSTNDILIYSAIVIGWILYIPMISGILRGKIEQSVATWGLWVVLDVIALISIIVQKGNYILLVCYCFGGTCIVIALLYKKLFKWTKFETLVLFLVFICLIIWYVSGPRWATISSTIAVCISGLPQIRDSWKVPDRMTGIIYTGYVLVNGLSCLGGKSWTIEERFYPGMCTILCVAITIAAFRKKRFTVS